MRTKFDQIAIAILANPNEAQPHRLTTLIGGVPAWKFLLRRAVTRTTDRCLGKVGLMRIAAWPLTEFRLSHRAPEEFPHIRITDHIPDSSEEELPDPEIDLVWRGDRYTGTVKRSAA